MSEAGLSDALRDPELMAAANDRAQELLEELKSEVKVETKDIGTLRKELTITVPGDIIAKHVDHNYDELANDAVVPGFRKGRAPRRLIEKRFGHDVRQSLKTTIIGQSFYAAADKAEIEPLGDPLFNVTNKEGHPNVVDFEEALTLLELPAEGDFNYSCELEIKPTFELPELKGIEVKTPQFEITDEQVDEQLERHRKIRGHYEPVTDGAAEPDDLIVADVTLKAGDQTVKTEENVQLGIRPTRLDGIALTELGEQLAGVKPGDTRTVTAKIPDDYERPDLRRQEAVFEFQVHELKRQVPAPVEELVQQSGAEDEAQLRQFIRDDLEAEKEQYTRRAQHAQLTDYLLENTPMDLPEDLSARQTDRAVLRRVIDLRQQGIPESDVEAKIDELRTSAAEDVTRDLKLGFILEKVAEELGVTVTDEEINTQIALIARRYDRRFDRVRDELQSQGLLSQLGEQIKHDKCLQQLLGEAKIVEVTPASAEAEAEAETPADEAAPTKKSTQKKQADESK
jgi:trigger factor